MEKNSINAKITEEHARFSYLSRLQNQMDSQVNAKLKRAQFECEKRLRYERKVQKWDDFRQRRAAAIDKYIQAKKEIK